MRVAAVQLDIVWEDKLANHARVEQMLDDAAIEAGTFVLLPELADTGFSFDLPAISDDRSLTWACDLAARRRIWLQHGHPEMADDGMGRNCATLIEPGGKPVGTYRKVHPFSYGREVDHYAGGDSVVLRTCDDARVCPMICYDLRFPELWRLAAAAGAELFTIGASWPDARQSHWRQLAIARAIENQAFVVAVNRVGADPHLSYAGGSLVVDPRGEILAEGATEPTVIVADLDVAGLRRWREDFPALRDIRPSLLGSIRLDTT